MTVTLNIGGEHRTADDKLHARVRRSLIERGLINPSKETYGYGERPCLTPPLVAQLRKKLLVLQIVIPREI